MMLLQGNARRDPIVRQKSRGCGRRSELTGYLDAAKVSPAIALQFSVG